MMETEFGWHEPKHESKKEKYTLIPINNRLLRLEIEKSEKHSKSLSVSFALENDKKTYSIGISSSDRKGEYGRKEEILKRIIGVYLTPNLKKEKG